MRHIQIDREPILIRFGTRPPMGHAAAGFAGMEINQVVAPGIAGYVIITGQYAPLIGRAMRPYGSISAADRAITLHRKFRTAHLKCDLATMATSPDQIVHSEAPSRFNGPSTVPKRGWFRKLSP